MPLAVSCEIPAFSAAPLSPGERPISFTAALRASLTRSPIMLGSYPTTNAAAVVLFPLLSWEHSHIVAGMDDLLFEIDAYCEAIGIKPTTLGRYAVNDGGFVARIRAGGQCLPRTAQKVRAYMLANPPRDDSESEERAA